MDLELGGRVALVAGAGRGIGAAIAERLAAEGASVGLLSRSEPELRAVAERIRDGGGQVALAAADVRDPTSTDAALDALGAELGPPVLFAWCVAARFEHARLPQVPDATLAELIDVDLLAAMRLVRRLIPGMLQARYGRIVLLSSAAAAQGIPGGAAYAVGKAGLEALARAVTVDHGRHGVLANAVRLGFVDTERLRGRGADPAALARRTPTRRIADPAQVAAMVAFLCSPLARSVAGTVIEVDDGLHLAAST